MKTPQTGDVFAFFLKRYGVYCPCQVVFQEKNSISVLFFQSFSKEMPNIFEVKEFQPLLLNHHAWEGDFFITSIEIPLSEGFFFLGNTEIIKKVYPMQVRNLEIIQLDLLYAWQQLPAFVQEGFRTMSAQKLSEKYKNKPEFAQINWENLTRAPIFLTEEVSLEQMEQIKQRTHYFSTQIQTEFFSNDLKIFLSRYPLLTSLTILKNLPKEIDLSTTYLQNIILKITDVEQIFLGKEVHSLLLMGDFSSLKDIICPFDGELLRLSLNFEGNFKAFSGFQKLKHLEISFESELDVMEMVSAFPNIEKLTIEGFNRKVRNISALKNLKNLKELTLSEVFGLEDFPKKEDFPNIKSLQLTKIAQEEGEKIKKEFKGIASVKMSSLRTELWVKTQAENPFRCWERGISASKYSQSIKIYAKTYEKISQENISEEEKQQFLQEFILFFNEMHPKKPISVVEKQKIEEAYQILACFTTMTDTETKNQFENSVIF